MCLLPNSVAVLDGQRHWRVIRRLGAEERAALWLSATRVDVRLDGVLRMTMPATPEGVPRPT
jgi:hypothetical protein